MKKSITAKQMLNKLKQEKINTWFDLGIFIDEFKENKPIPSAEFDGSYNEYKEHIKQGGLAFVTFYFSVDGVTLEVEKYAEIFRNNLKGIPIHYISGDFYPESEKLIHPATYKHQISEIKGFDDWTLYRDFFFTRLKRGSKEYNALITKFWAQVLTIVEKLGKYIEENNIRLLYLINVCSNPGNVSLTLATVLVSEYLGIPVINNNHDFYWEGGNKKVDIKEKGLKKGPRDFFFTNSHVGEFFSQIEVLFTWESRSWISVNINKSQSEHLIDINGHNPANVTEIGTAVALNKYQNITKKRKLNTLLQIEKALSSYQDTLIGYSIQDVINNNLVTEDNPKPVLIGSKTGILPDFFTRNIIFFQPTRVISRKRIEVGFKLLGKLFNNKKFIEKFKETSKLKLTIIVSGPIALGQYEYFEKLIENFSQLLDSISHEFCERIYLCFLFSEIDKEQFKKEFKHSIGVPELYNIASLVLLPSKTEGRGLPIIEAAASGVPIFCSRYEPQNVYSEVIGENLPEKDRLKVIEYDKKLISHKNIDDIVERVFFIHKFYDEIKHNKKVVQKRYSLEALNKNIEQVFYKLYLQLKSNKQSLAKTIQAIERYNKIVNFTNDDLKNILNTENRHYLPGYGRLAFMLYLKSLIDPSYFRVEHQEIRGMCFNFAKSLIINNPDYAQLPDEKLSEFYNAIDNIFDYKNGEFKIRHDHSFSYRHRNKNYYPYQDYTIQELTGLINLLYIEIIQPPVYKEVEQSSQFFTDWNLALSQLTSSSHLAIDDCEKLLEKLKDNLPIAYFPGKYVKFELELFALQSIRERLKLSVDEEISEEILKQHYNSIATFYVFAQEKPLGKWSSADDMKKFIIHGDDEELKLLYKYKILKVIKTNQLCVGIHFSQLGEEALKVLREIKEKKGFIISNRRNAAAMTDIVALDRFHIGRVTNRVAANIMGISLNDGYIQFVPAGIRTTLAYPTPIQTAKDFSETLKSDLYKKLCKEYGEQEILKIIKQDAQERGSPIKLVLENIKNKHKAKQDVEYSYVSGVYRDGLPYSGVIAKVIRQTGIPKKWKFAIVSSKDKTKRVTTFIEEFKSENKKETKIAWNGGYILNPELVGKLGLPESYIGSPLGLIISDNKLLSPPLFNKPAFIVYPDGTLDIKRVSSRNGITVSDNNTTIKFTASNYNLKNPGNKPCYYDLMYPEEYIEGNGRVIVRLAGNVIKEVIHTKDNEKVKIIPVGLTLSFTKDNFPESWDEIGKELIIKVNGIDNVYPSADGARNKEALPFGEGLGGAVLHAVEAGPMLIAHGKNCLDMKEEGWKTQNSIRTQAARLDFTDMRGPKIAIGLDKERNLYVLTINGRIRESVGATHIDMADIMLKFGMQKAMGFDPGGSSTLVVNGKILNISPYNSNYEKNVYSLPPEPRAVANAVIGYVG